MHAWKHAFMHAHGPHDLIMWIMLCSSQYGWNITYTTCKNGWKTFMIRTFHGHWASTDFTKNDFACMNCQRRGRSDEEVHTHITDRQTHTTHTQHTRNSYMDTNTRARARAQKKTHACTHGTLTCALSVRPSVRPSLPLFLYLSFTLSLFLPNL